MELKGLYVGHQTLIDKHTGITVFFFDHRATCNFFSCGSSPATSKLEYLRHSRHGKIDALVFSGGSAYGLGAVNGVMEWLRERDLGYHPVPHLSVPIVPAACIFDLSANTFHYPRYEDAYVACSEATADNLAQGRIGAGCGATVGKWYNPNHRILGGLGCATLRHQSGLVVRSYAVVNSVGNVVDLQGNIVAGDKKTPRDLQMLPDPENQREDVNTTLVAVFTNAMLTREELLVVSRMSAAGIARAIDPAYTPYDGDIVFAVSLGQVKASAFLTGWLASEVTRQAIINAVAK